MKSMALHSDYKSWIWQFARNLFEETGNKLSKKHKLVAFIPHYRPGSHCAVHQDNEALMRHEWIISVSLGCSVKFQYGTTKQLLKTTELSNLSVLGMSRFLYHGVPVIDGYRWNITFRCWKTTDEESVPRALSQSQRSKLLSMFSYLDRRKSALREDLMKEST